MTNYYLSGGLKNETMILDFTTLVKKYDLKIKGVIQVGAHFGQEYEDYVKNGIDDMVFIEPCKKAYEVLFEKLIDVENVRLINMACGNTIGYGTMYTGDETVNKGMSNSLLRPHLHLELHKNVEFTDTEEVSIMPLDAMILDEHRMRYNLLVMDCQGYEGNVLRGAVKQLEKIDYVYSEINFGEVYADCTQAEELDSLLHEFTRVETGQKIGGLWSDCLYIRKNIL